MNLKDILAISGLPGLYRFISQGKNSIIVESLTDKKRFAAYSSAKISALKDVAIFTDDGETPLKDVFSKIYEKEAGGVALNPKTSSDDQMKAYFAEILPDYDKEKVYLSDIRKVFLWYNALHQADLLNLPDEEEKDNEKEAGKEDAVKGEEKEDKTIKKKKPAPKKVTKTRSKKADK